MEIRFISSLTEEDEDRFAPAILNAVGHLLGQFPIAYTVRIETASGKICQSSNTTLDIGDARETGVVASHRLV